ncbi:D-alanyl-D-alanine endopeptidase [Pseudomonas citronellolis]|uniref:D-alanyl-D-alanine endopeptidase n=1 Tax=Pseudomonas citronellolis TaxID=53408 RepID=A0AAW6PG06_9PSED|nr:D-alanyl-D-alanine endopeptidase [Pseudomonas citronellolis]MDF3845539.1 D-alanyl-D-alanine endopeptidase [Pseudomonas citronellolis]WRT81856.1 D-alanyl-D-alanine endopeptidase [Pseudomonas citronellolis]
MNTRRSILGLFFTCTFALALPSLAASKAEVTPSQLVLASGSALVVDLNSDKVVYSSNPDVVRPIASVTKLMTAMVVLDAKLPLDEQIDVDISETAEMKGVFSRVHLGSRIDRRQMLLLALMSSENRAAASLAHHYPGGSVAFVKAMNAKAKSLGMLHTHYVEPTGLSIDNTSTAHDLIRLVKAAYQYPLIRELSTTATKDARFSHPNYALSFFNTNPLVRAGKWDIRLTKTGFTNQAGHCLVMVTVMNGRPVALALLDAFGKRTHVADAARIRRWVETGKASPVPAVALRYKQAKQTQGMQAAE